MGKYDDIINLARPISKNHKPMSIYDRSAQFAPFAALVGYEESIKEAGRKTEEKVELQVDKIEELSKKLSYLYEHQKEHPLLTITYFEKDKKKSGGSYLYLTGELKQLDTVNQSLIINKSKTIQFENIVDIIIGDINEK